jgi:hypothetical protein
MTTLPSDWLTHHRLDAEYKRYVVLAYLQGVTQRFAANRLCPDLPDLQRHYDDTLRFSRGKGSLAAAFPKRVAGISGPPPRIDYTTDVPTTDPMLQEVDEVVAFALPRFGQTLTEGRHRWHDLTATLTLEPVGVQPLRRDEGYLFVHYSFSTDLSVYQYRLTLYDDHVPGGRHIHWTLRERTRRSLGITFERMKLDLARCDDLPNPAAFRVESRATLEEQDTILPITQQLLNEAVRT